jgi:hypothetical protein
MPQVAIRPISKRSLSLVICLIAGVMLTALAASSAGAQEPAPPPAYIAAVEGNATLEREGETTPAVVNMPLIPGDRVRTTAGRVEIRFPDGTGIEVAEFSVVELVTDTRVRLLAGSVDRLEPLQANLSATSAPYLPQDLQMYGATFDQYGTWRYAPSYGYVWYPTVAAGWRPYHYGYWEPMRRYGWTWIGSDVWAWPTHHYGRWGHAGGAWFWVPGRTFGGAWVSWGSAPGYVSWCPLGFDNRPVFGLSIGFGSGYSGWTVVSNTHFGSRGYYAHRYAVDPGRLPRHTTFVTRSAPPVAVPRHVTNSVPGGGGVPGIPGINVQRSPGVAIPRGDRAIRAGTVESRTPPVTVSPAIRPAAPIVIPPAVSSGQPVRAGTRPSYTQPTPNDQRQTTQDTPPQRAWQRGAASQPQASQPPQQRQSQASQPQAAQPQAQPPPPQQATPRAVPRQSAPQQPAAQQPAAPQNSNGDGQGGGHQRAGATAQPRTDGGSPNGTARRR